MCDTDGTVGETRCAILSYLEACRRGPQVGLPAFCPPGPWLMLPASTKMKLSIFSIPCLFIKDKCSHVTSLYVSNFHSECDLHLIKGNNQRHRTKSPHLCSHTALSWQLQEENTMLLPICTAVEVRGSSQLISINLHNYLCFSTSSILNRCHPFKRMYANVKSQLSSYEFL